MVDAADFYSILRSGEWPYSVSINDKRTRTPTYCCKRQAASRGKRRGRGKRYCGTKGRRSIQEVFLIRYMFQCICHLLYYVLLRVAATELKVQWKMNLINPIFWPSSASWYSLCIASLPHQYNWRLISNQWVTSWVVLTFNRVTNVAFKEWLALFIFFYFDEFIYLLHNYSLK